MLIKSFFYQMFIQRTNDVDQHALLSYPRRIRVSLELLSNANELRNHPKNGAGNKIDLPCNS
jgi:hypothetical protein